MALPPDLLDFIRELELNNNREWFQANKPRYETSVKQPVEELAATMIERMKEVFPGLDVTPNDVLFRIYRDVRFSRDKSPYKTHLGMAIGPKGRHDPNSTSCYFHVGPREMFFGSGYYMVDPQQLRTLRTHIAANLDEFAARLEDREFKLRLGTVQGERNKVLPPEFRAAGERQPLLYNKQFYYGTTLEAEEALREDLPDHLMTLTRAALPMNAFLRRAFE